MIICINFFYKKPLLVYNRDGNKILTMKAQTVQINISFVGDVWPQSVIKSSKSSKDKVTKPEAEHDKQ